ncbi:MAG: T9SS type A sorting domain-containing protein [Saprospiraceae bacterium]
MKNFITTALLLIFGALGLNAQNCYADFESPGLNFLGLDGVLTSPEPNPNANAINSSANCAKYIKSNMHAYSLILADNGAPFDLSVNNQFSIDVFATAATKILFKLEGSGGGFEHVKNITVTGEWVRYTFDFSAQAFNTGLSKVVMFFDPGVEMSGDTYYFDNVCAGTGKLCHADFEGPGLNFLGLDGVLTAPVANPTPNAVNNSANCAQYVKSNMHAYSLILADNGTPFDLSVNNQFKIDILATAATQFIFKLEGSGGGFEVTKNIAVTGAWQTYTIDFSAQAANTGLSKIVMFFDPGVETSGDTYYFDNVCAVPNPCPNDTPDPDRIDDFECNRNATYTGDWSVFSDVTNPAPTGDNNSPKVGRFEDPVGPGSEWSNIQIDYQNPIDLTVRNQFSCQVWAPKAGNLLIKLEGGPNPPMEMPNQVTELNKWVTYTVDFSSQIGKGHKKFVIFFNAGVPGEPGDVYHIDNIKLAAPATAPPLEDFQDGIHLGWQALDQNEPIHGMFQGPVNNPTPNGVNNSTKVGCYTKGSSAFSTLQGISLNNFDLSVYGQFNLDVLSPQGGGTVTLILSSPVHGNKEAEATITTPGQWETLSFDFSAFSAITDFSEVRIIFNAGTANSGQIWYFDNLRQTEVTIDPCDGVVPILNIVDDYECQRNYTQIFYGGSDLKVVNNPHLAPENGSLKVGEYNDPAGAGTEFAGIGIEFPAPPDLSVYNHLSMQVWSPEANVPFLFKLEGSGPGVEVFDTLTQANTWYKFDIDFSGAIGTQHTKLVIFTNVLSATGGGTYFFDNIRWARAGYNGCIVDHQAAPTTLAFTYFANGHLEAEGYQFEVVDNPNAAGINTSSKVGKFVKASDGAPFAGMYSNPNLESPIDWKGVKTVKAKVHMDHIGNFAVKVEGSQTGAPALELKVANTVINQWEELTYDFSTVPDNGEYRRLTLFFDLGIDATGTDVTSYFDEIVIGDGECGSVSTFSPADVSAMRVSPNPATDYLKVENMESVARLEVFDLMGRRVAVANTSGDTFTDLDVSQFPTGMYLLNGFDRNGVLIGMAKFIRH